MSCLCADLPHMSRGIVMASPMSTDVYTRAARERRVVEPAVRGVAGVVVTVAFFATMTWRSQQRA
jgi:hypothetical protein